MLLNILQVDLIPRELSIRKESMDLWVALLLFLCFSLIAFARYSKAGTFWSLAVSNVRMKGVRSYLSEEFPLNKRSSILLMINYFFSFFLLLTLWFKSDPVALGRANFLILVVPFVYFFWTIGSMLVMGLISGEKEVFSEPIAMKIVGVEVLGVVLFGCSLIWSINAVYEPLLLRAIGWVFIAGYTLRSLKSMISVYLRGISWYYIILYFCTLEILPLFVAYYLINGDFSA